MKEKKELKEMRNWDLFLFINVVIIILFRTPKAIIDNIS